MKPDVAELTRRVAAACKGESEEDVAFVCCAMALFVSQKDPELRIQIAEFMAAMIEQQCAEDLKKAGLTS